MKHLINPMKHVLRFIHSSGERNKHTLKSSKGSDHFIGMILLAFCFFFISSAALFAQYETYYGKNKVIKQKFNWKHVETAHYKIYYYTTDENLIKKIAKRAEAAYDKISDYLGVQIEEEIPLIFYTTHIEFEQTNIIGYLPPGVVAFSEPAPYRMVLQGDLPFDELSHTLTHELAHIFEYAVMGKSARYFSPPLWIMEGFAEFMTETWGEFNLLTVRDMVLADRIPQMTKSGELDTPYYNDRIIPYDFGHIIYEFLDKKFGKRGVKLLLNSIRGNALFRFTRGGDFLKVLNYTPKMFNHEFGKYVRERFKMFAAKEDPEDYSYIIGPDFPYVYSFSHQASPSGEMLAVMTVSYKTYNIEIILISTKDGKIIKRITPGFTRKYDNINLKFDPTDGLGFSWDKNSNRIAFFARKELDNFLIVMDIISGDMIKKIKIENIQEPTNPIFHPSNKKLYFTGLEHTKSYLYAMDLDTGNSTKVSNGVLFIKGFDIASDGTRITYSAKSDNLHYKIFLGTIDNPEAAKQLTTGEYNDITPSFSADGSMIYYASNEKGSYNINSINLKDNMLTRYTDVKTGNFFPIELPGEKDTVVMSSFYKGLFNLFKKDLSTQLETRKIEIQDVNAEMFAKKETEDLDLKGIEFKFRGKYVPFKKFYLKSLPPVNVAIGSDGGFYGYSYLTLTDLMGDIDLSFFMSTFYGYRSYDLAYLNQKRRLQLYAHLFAYKEVYYYNELFFGDNLTVRSMYGGEAGFYYPFNRSYRAEATVSAYKQNENFANLFYEDPLPYGQFFTGWAYPVRFSLVGETTGFADYGPNMGHTFKVSYTKFVKLGAKSLDAYSVYADVRKYLRLDNYSLLALRLSGYKSGGKNPLLIWTGGNNTFHSQGFRQMTGNNMILFNAEFRFPLVHAAATPIGVVGPIRGVFFFDLGGIWYNGEKFRFFEKGKGIKLQDAISSYGFGLEFFLLGYPMHVEWVWRTDMRKRDYHGVNFWIGYDF